MHHRQSDLLILACLRDLNMRFYFEVLISIASGPEDFEQTKEAVAEVSKNYGDGLFAKLTDSLGTAEYRAFIDDLNDTDPTAAHTAQTLLETKEYEIRLARLKEKSVEQYLNELREVTADELIRAIVDGTVVNATSESGTPLPIANDENYSGTFLDHPTATASLDTGTLLQVLNHFSSPQNDIVASAQGLRLRQVVIRGSGLNLNWLRIPFPLGFQGCDFYAWVSADYLRVPWLSFENCDFTPRDHVMPTPSGALNAAHLEVEHELRFWKCRGISQLFIPDAKIGSFSLENQFAGEGEGSSAGAFRTVIDGSNFGNLHVPTVKTIPLSLNQSLRVDRINGEYTAIERWLRTSGAEAPVWDSIADALARSGRGDDASNLRIAYKRNRNSNTYQHPRTGKPRNPIARFFVWLFADFTVRYFHKPFRAIWLLVGVFALTWVLAFAFHDQLIKSPLANEPVPAHWLQEQASALAWSFMYALDSSFSPLSLGQLQTMWPSSVWLVLLLAGLKSISIILLGLFIAAATNLVGKRSS